MSSGETVFPESISPEMVAPCGMNCTLCIGHLRDKKSCPGCSSRNDAAKPAHCVVCRIKECEELIGTESGFCFECAKFPCVRLRQLDKRYTAKYGMSMIENLRSIQADGLEVFVKSEKMRWSCPGCGAVICVHRDACLYCGRAKD